MPIGQIPEYTDIIGNKRYDTSKAKLLAYTVGYTAHGHNGPRKGKYFSSLYKTVNGNYFLYSYMNDRLFDNYQNIRTFGTEFPMGVFRALTTKLVNVENEIEIIEA